MNHLVLLGDSIFDNDRYVPGGPSVIEHVRQNLPSGWKSTLCAIDGSLAVDVLDQLRKVPDDATHLVVSAGGNNALDHAHLLLGNAAASFVEVLTAMTAICAEFQTEYRRMLNALKATGLPVFACTVYDMIPNFSSAERSGLALFNEVILREAFRAEISVVDLRLICDKESDYSPASPIEPSVSGGGKIARAVIRAATAPKLEGIQIWT